MNPLVKTSFSTNHSFHELRLALFSHGATRAGDLHNYRDARRIPQCRFDERREAVDVMMMTFTHGPNARCVLAREHGAIDVGAPQPKIDRRSGSNGFCTK